MTHPRLFTGDTLVIATHNKGKVPEIAALLKDHVANFPSAGELGLGEPEETETTYIGNAVLKARAAAIASGLPALADDSGLSVDGLNGDPGVYSARWAGPTKDFTLAMDKVRVALDASTDRKGDRAAFICALALAWPDGHVEAVEGRFEGRLTFPARGARGFGYDPIFIPDGYDITCGEMDPDLKHAISHRADAFAKLKARCFHTG
ncbi:RdgB/HAM1 family non-canonical purine NTP pyrophosphatase [Niveispirillum cyanobacteriorum]|uniref:dITP/XTP pyrophosphatase n=1 Tax=Niveispirillum cyanobacteriorum TaxID=1612173 RepID=A0A2K9NBF4_9PROT|nr:RdgB/HAM1 family non-canonical purine NTP pyrophosphatase [Niveispirillum cyanobacteriorum]AUN30471.1 non-canonical purine NTP pyrophosphatase, RdgB/HAM1 family [Niveispirillum cyanobacteriorum]GGE54299.1 non-canonical purine NTP pyrophosphatase [Niveispirillum cyanobacteriorum]